MIKKQFIFFFLSFWMYRIHDYPNYDRVHWIKWFIFVNKIGEKSMEFPFFFWKILSQFLADFRFSSTFHYCDRLFFLLLFWIGIFFFNFFFKLLFSNEFEVYHYLSGQVHIMWQKRHAVMSLWFSDQFAVNLLVNCDYGVFNTINSTQNICWAWHIK